MTLAKTILPCLLLLFAVLLVPARAQEQSGQTVEGQLLEILKKRGVINQGEYGELKALARKLRNQDNLEERLNGAVEKMVARLADEQPTTSYKVGKGFGWSTPDGKFAMRIGGRLQVRLSFSHFTDDNHNRKNDDRPNFTVPRARIWVRGHAFQPYWKYKFQFDIAGDEADTTVSGSKFSSTNRLTELKDAWVEFAKWHQFTVRGGQFKVPYSRQELTSSGKQQFVDRSLIGKVFVPGRNSGVMVFGRLGGEKDHLLEYYAGVFDGEGENKTNNDQGLMYAGRVAVNPFGQLKYTESDLRPEEKWNKFLLAIGANGYVHQDDNLQNQDDDWSVGGDLAAMWRGFSGLAELHYRKNGVKNGRDVKILGWLGQLGYMLIPETLEVALRADSIDYDNSMGQSAQREYLLVLGYFMEGHDLKIQADFGRVERHYYDTSKNKDEWRFRLQFQLIF